jgi:hypothetical protein
MDEWLAPALGGARPWNGPSLFFSSLPMLTWLSAFGSWNWQDAGIVKGSWREDDDTTGIRLFAYPWL